MTRLDTWIVVPAIASAVFTMVAISPPTSAARAGLRIETLGAHEAGRPVLVRVAIDEGGDIWRAPATATLRLEDSAGHWSTGLAHAARGSTFAYGEVTPVGDGPYRLAVMADGFVESATLPARAACVSHACDPAAPGDETVTPGGVEITIEGGVLVPEVPATVFVRAGAPAGTLVSLGSEGSSIEFVPEQAALDACGIAAFRALVVGMNADATVRLGPPPGHVWHRRFTLSPGAVALSNASGTPEVITPAGGQTVYRVGGDARGPTTWSAVYLTPAGSEISRAPAATAAGLRWVLASLSPSLEAAVGMWLEAPAPGGCATTPTGIALHRARWPLPDPGAIEVVRDGGAIARRDHEQQRRRVRNAALGLAGLSMAMLVALVLRAGLRKDAREIQSVASPRERMWVALASAGALLIGALVLLSAFLLRV